MIEKGVFELFYGPMKSGKTKALIERVQGVKPEFMMFIKPSVDTRNAYVWSRAYPDDKFPCRFVNHKEPMTLIEAVHIESRRKPNLGLIAIDEMQFFGDNIVSVIQVLSRHYNVIASGLDRDFRGEYFGEMGDLITTADFYKSLTARCDVSGCKNKATRTQRLIDGEPAHYDSPLIVIDGGVEVYEAKCLDHHIVPRD